MLAIFVVLGTSTYLAAGVWIKGWIFLGGTILDGLFFGAAYVIWSAWRAGWPELRQELELASRHFRRRK